MINWIQMHADRWFHHPQHKTTKTPAPYWTWPSHFTTSPLHLLVSPAFCSAVGRPIPISLGKAMCVFTSKGWIWFGFCKDMTANPLVFLALWFDVQISPCRQGGFRGKKKKRCKVLGCFVRSLPARSINHENQYPIPQRRYKPAAHIFKISLYHHILSFLLDFYKQPSEVSCLRNTRVILPGYRNERADKKRFKKELGYGHLIQKKKKPFVKNSYKQHHPTMLSPILSFRLNWKEKKKQCSTQDRLHAGAS